MGHQEEFYLADEGRILGSEEFVDATIHRIGETRRILPRTNQEKPNNEFNAEALIEAVESICRIRRAKFCGSCKSVAAITAKEMLVLIGREMGASLRTLSEISGISSSAVSRRNDAAKLKVQENGELSRLAASIRKRCRQP